MGLHAEIAERVGTPLYVYDTAVFRAGIATLSACPVPGTCQAPRATTLPP